MDVSNNEVFNAFFNLGLAIGIVSAFFITVQKIISKG